MTESITYSVPARNAPEGWKPFGWQGLTCVIPEDWDVSGIDGNDRKGYYTFDDERSRRMEVKFDQARRIGKPQLDKTLEDYFKAVRKEIGGKEEFEVDYGVDLADEGTVPAGFDFRTYGWTGQYIVRGMIWHCNGCGRVVIAQCFAEKNRANLREMSRAPTSIRCHPEAEENLWAVFDFATEIPAVFRLETNKLQAGLTSLTFNHKRRRLVVERVGLVQAILKHREIDDYVENVHYKKLRRRRIRFFEELWHGHPGYRMEGERSRLTYRIPVVGAWLRSIRRGDHVGGRVWRSEEVNRLYIIRAEGRDAQDLADHIAESIVAYER